MPYELPTELRRSRFLLMLGALPLSSCAQRSILPTGQMPSLLARRFSEPGVEITPTVDFPLPRPDGVRPSLYRSAQPFAPGPRHEQHHGLTPGAGGYTTLGHITTYGYYDQHYYETYYKDTLKLQIYVSAPNTNGIPKKFVNSQLTSKITVPNSIGKLPWHTKYATASKDKALGPGYYKITRNSNGKKLVILNTTVSPAVFKWPGGWELNCPGAWAFAYLEMFLYDFWMEIQFEILAALCAGDPACVIAAWDYTQEAEQQYEDYMKQWAQNYCETHGKLKVNHGPHQASSSSCSGGSYGSGGSSSGGWSSSGGYGGPSSGCDSTHCITLKRNDRVNPLQTIP